MKKKKSKSKNKNKNKKNKKNKNKKKKKKKRKKNKNKNKNKLRLCSVHTIKVQGALQNIFKAKTILNEKIAENEARENKKLLVVPTFLC